MALQGQMAPMVLTEPLALRAKSEGGIGIGGVGGGTREVPQGQVGRLDLLVVAQEVPQAKVAQAGAQEESQQRPARTASA